MVSKKPILAIGGTHFPAVHHTAMEKMFSIISELPAFGHIVQLGDLYDQFSQSSFPKNPNYITPREETEISRVMAEEFWDRMTKMFPRAKKWQLVGNHGKPRIIKKVMAAAPECLHLLSIDQLWEFNGVETIPSYQDHLTINGINFIHGWSSRPGFHRDYFEDDVVNTHTHRGHVLPKKLRDRIITELNVGYLADPFHPFLQYRPMRKIEKWTHGFGIIDELGPRFVPL